VIPQPQGLAMNACVPEVSWVTSPGSSITWSCRCTNAPVKLERRCTSGCGPWRHFPTFHAPGRRFEVSPRFTQACWHVVIDGQGYFLHLGKMLLRSSSKRSCAKSLLSVAWH